MTRGPVTGSQLETRVKSATNDLMGKLPGADRLKSLAAAVPPAQAPRPLP